MPQIIEVPDIGEFEFPDNYTDDQIRSSLMPEIERIQSSRKPKLVSEPETEAPNPIARAARSFARGATQMVASIPESIAIGANKLADITGVRLGAPEKVQDSPLYQTGKTIRTAV